MYVTLSGFPASHSCFISQEERATSGDERVGPSRLAKLHVKLENECSQYLDIATRYTASDEKLSKLTSSQLRLAKTWPGYMYTHSVRHNVGMYSSMTLYNHTLYHIILTFQEVSFEEGVANL